MRILLVDDDKLIRRAITNFMEAQLGHQVTQCDNGEDALKVFRENPFPMVLTDIKMPGISGIELLNKLKELPEGKTADIVLITGHGDLNTAIQALRGGAYDYLLKPVDVEEMAAIVDRIAEHQTLLRENYELRHQFDEKIEEVTRETHEKLKQIQTAYAEIAGVGEIGVFSDKMQAVISMAEQFHKDRSIPVLIEGETGTGKEIIAHLIHYGKGEITTPFISINCAAIPPNLFESELFGYEAGAFSGANKSGMTGKVELAQKGTLFLDEIGDLPPDLQPKLLRAIQEREIYRIGGTKKIVLDIRIICATNRDLKELMEKEKFRQDLYYRLHTGRLHIPPLRETPEAIAPFAQFFLEKFASEKKRHFKYIQKNAIRILESYPWKGNIRELKNTIERIVLLYNTVEITPGHLTFLSSAGDQDLLPADSQANRMIIEFPQDRLAIEEIEAGIIKKVLLKFNGNKTQAAAYLNMSRNTLRKKLEK